MFTRDEKDLVDRLSVVAELSDSLHSLADASEKNLTEIKTVEENVARMIKEKARGFPWLADAIAQYHEYRDLKIADFLKRKLRPAVASSERVREIAAEKRVLHRQLRVTRNLIKYYEALFPWLAEFVGEDVDELIEQAGEESKSREDGDDRARIYLTEGEYGLPTVERNQRALDRWWKSRKTPWQLGRDYERYIGYLYEKHGCKVRYQGIVEGFKDLGRDLIAEAANGTVEVIQCKYWAQHRTIHEKHINQLFGTAVEYWVKNREGLCQQLSLFPDILESQKIVPCFVTSTSLSETAREFASVLRVKVLENFPFEAYPCIKCNVSRATGEKIYHLPFDQQYDTTLIEPERGECYVETVEEAEGLGFRRAFRWKGSAG